MLEIDHEVTTDLEFFKSYFENLKQKGVTGKWYEDFVPGEIITHPRSFKIKELDNLLISLATTNLLPLQLDQHGFLVAAAVMGYLTVEELTYRTLLATRKFEVQHRRPVFIDDEIVAITQILEKDRGDKGSHASQVRLRHDVVNQKMQRVMIINREILVYHKPNY